MRSAPQKKLKLTKDHELASLKTVNNKRPDKLTFFEHESKVADCYCFTFEEFVCPSWDYEEHNQHKTEPFDVAANIKRNLLIKTWQTSEIFISTERNLNIISERKSHIEKSEKEAKDRLHRRAVKMKGDIEAAVKKLEAGITTICERNVWIAKTGTDGLIMFNEQGSKQKKVMEDFEIESMAMGQDGTLFVSLSKEKFIYKITENYEARQLCSLSSRPGDLAAFENGNIAVCCNEPPKLVIIDQTGRIVRQYAPRASTFKTLHCVAVCKFTDVLAVCEQDMNIFTETKQLDADIKETIEFSTAKTTQGFPVGMNTKVSTQSFLNPFCTLLPTSSKSSVDAPKGSKVKPMQEISFGLYSKAPLQPASSSLTFLSAANSKSAMDAHEAIPTQAISSGTPTNASIQPGPNPFGIFSAASTNTTVDKTRFPEIKTTQTTQESFFKSFTNVSFQPVSRPIVTASRSNSSVAKT
ncbi:hypothetical protein CHS0354_022497 [Potamilus streckersoni]|uniref:Uncharacterized protein n=1 Tax=Potamilus streckersoni TaxID=2493646 RepID=A0AAE0W487_9BIVA|nr:hypothetical protein CHS0354_022497 [Potamilus streckersoni]